MPFDVEKVRLDFPMLRKEMHGKPLVYFDSAATSQKPYSVIETVRDYYENHYGTVHRAVYQLAAHATHEYQTVRESVRRFLNAERSEEIVFTRGATDAINLVASSFGKAFIRPGDEVLISEIEHHSNLIPWQMMCEERQAILRVLPVNDLGELRMDLLEEMLSEKTKIVAIGHISNALGTLHPVKEVIRLAHSYGAKVLIDGAQAAGHMPIDVQDLDADFYVFSSHKALGPTGAGILYGKLELLEQLPPYQGGGDMIDQVGFDKSTYNAVPMKFEAGTPMIASVLGLGAAIEYLNAVGLEEIHHWEQQLLAYATMRLQKTEGVRIIGNAAEKSGIISFVVEGMHPMDIGTLLDLQGVAIRTGHHCSQTALKRFGVTSTCRISFGLYNTKDEIDSFMEALHSTRLKLC